MKKYVRERENGVNAIIGKDGVKKMCEREREKRKYVKMSLTKTRIHNRLRKTL